MKELQQPLKSFIAEGGDLCEGNDEDYFQWMNQLQ